MQRIKYDTNNLGNNNYFRCYKFKLGNQIPFLIFSSHKILEKISKFYQYFSKWANLRQL